MSEFDRQSSPSLAIPLNTFFPIFHTSPMISGQGKSYSIFPHSGIWGNFLVINIFENANGLWFVTNQTIADTSPLFHNTTKLNFQSQLSFYV